MKKYQIAFLIFLVSASFVLAQTSTEKKPASAARFDTGVISGLGIRNIGPSVPSGRIAAMAARNIGGKTLLYVGAASGGVWKSEDGGTTLKPVFDKQPVQSIGAVTIDPTNPKIVWVGTGESWTRNSVSIGDGIYKSTDGGESWTNMGLKESERIVKILIDPKDGNTVYACVPGKLWSDSADRGLYKTTDGGKTWNLILKGSNLSTGCSGLSMDPQNSSALFAGLWDFRRKGWTFRSGGDGPDAPSGSGLFRSTDGGKTWKELEAGKNGLPPKPYGRIEVEIAPSNSKIVYAFIEGIDSALYRSDDGGTTWEQRDKSQMMVWRPFYFAKLIVDPKNPDRVFKTDLFLIVSEDGGKSFSNTGGGSHGDWHDLWIDPDNTKHLIGGDDGGLWISNDGGNRWLMGENLPVAQFYHVDIDDQDPYQVYGGLQDNTNWIGDSEYPGGVTVSQWESVLGGDGFYAFSDPADPNYVYAETQGGEIARYNRKTHDARNIKPTPGYKEKLRFNWNTPMALSPNEKGTLYIGAQFLFRTRDHGQTWERISPDLTTNDPEKQKQEQSGGITVDNSSAETHTTIYSISESPKNGKLIWIGTDDGNVQLTQDGGKTWNNVVGNIKGLPPASWVSHVEASQFNEATAYATFDRHTFGDMNAYVYKTTDFGKTWSRIAGPEQGLRGYAHVVKEDAVKPDLLFVGTELGLWITNNGGKTWAEFKGGNFPSVAVRDIAVHPEKHDVVLGTHGRGIWIIDDDTPVRQVTDSILQNEAQFLETRPVTQQIEGDGGWVQGDARFVGQNPEDGAMIAYYQRTRHLFGPIKLEILDASGKVIDTIPASKRRGLNRVPWSMRVPPPRVPKAAQLAFNATRGPRVVPGTYTVRLTKDKQVYESKLAIKLDPRAKFTVEDRQAQFDAAMRMVKMFGDMSDVVDKINSERAILAQAAAKLPADDAFAKELTNFSIKLDEVRKKIVATKEGGAITGEERLREHADAVYGAILSYEGHPTKYQLERIDVLQRELDDVMKEFNALTTQELPKINEGLKSRNLPPLTP
ncbi:sialidase [bacterium]|nr:sialidase [bacterium]MCI0613463.1 sialidase [bacterium]